MKRRTMKKRAARLYRAQRIAVKRLSGMHSREARTAVFYAAYVGLACASVRTKENGI